MKSIFYASAIGLSFITTAAVGQRAHLTEGSLDALQGVTAMNVKYDYSNMEVGKKSEREYIADKKEKLNDKEPGRGDKWEASWIADRHSRFEPRFEESFNKHGDIQLKPGSDEKYTLIFRTVYTEPGYNVGVVRHNAYIHGEVLVVETANPGNTIARLHINTSPGRDVTGFDFDTGERIQEAYAMAGKGLANFSTRSARAS